ncbi:MAG: glycosyltransferase family 2 protein [Ignavibacteria bacterium]
MKNIYVIIPAVNEEQSIGKVIRAISLKTVKEIIVVDNGSDDDTINAAKKNGATVLQETERGYGAACLKGLEYIFAKCSPDDIIVFLDGDYSDYPEEMIDLVTPIIDSDYDFVVGSRIMGKKHGRAGSGALLPQAIFGNWLSTKLIKIIWNYSFTDLGPFRAIKATALKNMKMKDRNFGWTVEMQIKASKMNLKCKEIPVSYRKRIGKSKVTGTVAGSVKAGIIIISTIFSHTLKKSP